MTKTKKLVCKQRNIAYKDLICEHPLPCPYHDMAVKPEPKQKKEKPIKKYWGDP